MLRGGVSVWLYGTLENVVSVPPPCDVFRSYFADGVRAVESAGVARTESRRAAR
jgi:hypothetical protein